VPKRLTVDPTGTTTISYFVRDKASNVEQANAFEVKIDRVALGYGCDPAAAPTARQASNVIFACAPSDGISGLAGGSAAPFTLSTDVAAGSETANASTGTKTLVDTTDHSVTAPTMTGIKVDKKAPETAACAGTCTEGDWVNKGVTVILDAKDLVSGVKAIG
jgi:hypothetical protein